MIFFPDRSVLLEVVQQLLPDTSNTNISIIDENIAKKAAANASENGETSNNVSSVQVMKLWTPERTLMFRNTVEKFQKYLEECIKRNVWQRIANLMKEKSGITFNPSQCDTKWKGLVKHYKLVKKHNETSDNEPKHWEYYEKLYNILFKKPEINPVATCSNTKGLFTSTGSSNSSSATSISKSTDE